MLIQGDLQVARRSSAGLAINVPAWQSGKDYLINDMFIFGGDLYFVVANHTSTTVPADASSLNRVDLTNDVVYQAGAAVPAVTKINSYNTAASIGAAPTVVPASTYSTYERDSGRLRVYIADSLGTAWQEVADTLIIVARLNSTQTSLAPGVYDLDSSGGVFDLTLQDTVGMWEFHNTNMSLGTNVVTLLSGGSKTFTDVTGTQVASDFVLNTSGLPVKVLHTELGNDYRVSIQRGDVANDRVFIPDSAVAPAIAGDPTALEVAAWGPTTTDTVAYYTGTDAAADPVIAVYHFDAAGAVTKIGNLVRLRSPDTNTYTESVNGQINFVVDGNPVGNVVWDTGLNMPKWTLLGGLDPSYFALTAVSTVQRDALVATSPLTKIGWLVLHDNGLVKTHQWWDGAAWKDFGGTASDRLFLASSVVAPASPNNPTLSEIATAVGTSRNVIAYFTGSDTSTDAVSHAYHVDNSGNVTLLEKPSSSSWILQGSPVSLTANQNYIFLADGNYPLPAGAAAGDTVSVIASSGAVTLTATGVFFSGPGQLVTNPGDQLALPAYVRFDLFNVGGGNWAVIKAFDSRLAVADLTADGVLGSLDKLLANVWILGQTTAGVIATLPVSSALATSILTIINGGTVPITIEGSSVNVGDIRRFYWDGTAWLVEPAPVVIPAFLPWAAATVFTADQYVEYLGEIYRCLSDHTSSASFFADMTGGGYWSHVSTDRDYVGQILDATTSEPVAPSAGLFILHSGVDGLGSVSGFSFAGGNVYVGDGTTWQGVSSIDGMRFYDILSSRTYVVRSGTWSPLVTRHIVQSIVDFTAAEPPAPQAGQWFIHSGVTGVGSVSTTVTFNSQSLYGYNGSNFFELIPIDGEEAYNRADNASYTFNGGTWLPPADPGTVWQFTTGATLVLAGEAWVVNSGHTVTLPTSPTAGDSILFAPGNGDWNTLNATFTAPGATTVGAGQTAMPTGADVMTFVYDGVTDNWYVFAGDSPALELYRGQLASTAVLTSLPAAQLIDGMSYVISNASYYWSATASSGALEPDDKVAPGVNPGYWIQISSPVADAVQVLNASGAVTAWNTTVLIGSTALTADAVITLPACIGNVGKKITLNRVDGAAFKVTLTGTGADVLTYSTGNLSSKGGSITLIADSTSTAKQVTDGRGIHEVPAAALDLDTAVDPFSRKYFGVANTLTASVTATLPTSVLATGSAGWVEYHGADANNGMQEMHVFGRGVIRRYRVSGVWQAWAWEDDDKLAQLSFYAIGGDHGAHVELTGSTAGRTLSRTTYARLHEKLNPAISGVQLTSGSTIAAPPAGTVKVLPGMYAEHASIPANTVVTVAVSQFTEVGSVVSGEDVIHYRPGVLGTSGTPQAYGLVSGTGLSGSAQIIGAAQNETGESMAMTTTSGSTLVFALPGVTGITVAIAGDYITGTGLAADARVVDFLPGITATADGRTVAGQTTTYYASPSLYNDLSITNSTEATQRLVGRRFASNGFAGTATIGAITQPQETAVGGVGVWNWVTGGGNGWMAPWDLAPADVAKLIVNRNASGGNIADTSSSELVTLNVSATKSGSYAAGTPRFNWQISESVLAGVTVGRQVGNLSGDIPASTSVTAHANEFNVTSSQQTSGQSIVAFPASTVVTGMAVGQFVSVVGGSSQAVITAAPVAQFTQANTATVNTTASLFAHPSQVSSANIVIGQLVSGSGIPAATKITVVGTDFAVAKASTASAVTALYLPTGTTTTEFVANRKLQGTTTFNAAANVNVVSVTAQSVIDGATTSGASEVYLPVGAATTTFAAQRYISMSSLPADTRMVALTIQVATVTDLATTLADTYAFRTSVSALPAQYVAGCYITGTGIAANSRIVTARVVETQTVNYSTGSPLVNLRVGEFNADIHVIGRRFSATNIALTTITNNAVLTEAAYTVGTTNASTTVTSTSFGAADVGRYITGAGIPALARITAVTPGVSAVISAAATATASITATLGHRIQVGANASANNTAATATYGAYLVIDQPATATNTVTATIGPRITVSAAATASTPAIGTAPSANVTVGPVVVTSSAASASTNDLAFALGPVHTMSANATASSTVVTATYAPYVTINSPAPATVIATAALGAMSTLSNSPTVTNALTTLTFGGNYVPAVVSAASISGVSLNLGAILTVSGPSSATTVSNATFVSGPTLVLDRNATASGSATLTTGGHTFLLTNASGTADDSVFTFAPVVTLSQAATGSINGSVRFFPYGNGNGSTTFNLPPDPAGKAIGVSGVGTQVDMLSASCDSTAGSTTLTSSGQFVAGDVGRRIYGPTIQPGTTIVAFASSSSITLSLPATATVSNSAGFGIARATAASLRAINDVSGAEQHTLVTAELANHNHTYSLRISNAGGGSGSTYMDDASSASSGSYATSATGGGLAHNNMSPTWFGGRMFIYVGV